MNATEWIAEQRIREAQKDGFFDVPSYRGIPLVLEDPVGEYWLAHKILKNGGFLPPEVELRNAIASLKDKLQHSRVPEEHRALAREINALLLRMNLAK